MDYKKKHSVREVVVTGIGLVTPLECGKGLDAFWDSIMKGKNAIGPVEMFDTSPYGCSVAAEIKGIDEINCAERWFSLIDRAFREALNDSGLALELVDKKRAGISVGTILGGIILGENCWRDGTGEPPYEYNLYSAANRLSEKFGLRGPVTTVSTACASGTDSIGIAYRNILMDRADVMIAGGGDSLSEFAFSGFSCLNALTKSVVRPFDKNRDGLALGEGAAFLVLEEKRLANKRGAHIYGKITGYASSGDANHMTGPDKNGAGLSRAITGALREAGLESVDYINAHGTGTPYNDVMETKAIKNIFGKRAYDIPISSIKSMLGHSFGAAGVIEAAVCFMTMVAGILPPTINIELTDPECDLDYIRGKARNAQINSSISLSAGFGGQNSAIVCTPF